MAVEGHPMPLKQRILFAKQAACIGCVLPVLVNEFWFIEIGRDQFTTSGITRQQYIFPNIAAPQADMVL